MLGVLGSLGSHCSIKMILLFMSCPGLFHPGFPRLESQLIVSSPQKSNQSLANFPINIMCRWKKLRSCCLINRYLKMINHVYYFKKMRKSSIPSEKKIKLIACGTHYKLNDKTRWNWITMWCRDIKCGLSLTSEHCISRVRGKMKLTILVLVVVFSSFGLAANLPNDSSNLKSRLKWSQRWVKQFATN